MTEENKYDVIIVGAGPAGMFAANELADRMKVLVIDKGKNVEERICRMENGKNECLQCSPCSILYGSGGSGTLSDGILNLRPDVGGDLAEQTGDSDYAWQLVNHVDEIFVKYGAPDNLYIPKGDEIEMLKIRAASVDAQFIEITQRHIGSNNAPRVIGNFEKDLVKRGVRFLYLTEVTDIDIVNGRCHGVILKDGTKINAGFVIMAPGRVGSNWVDNLVQKHSICAKYAPIDIGVRVEVPAIIMNSITKINRDPKFHIRTRTYDDFVRTFCTNARGFVVKEDHTEGIEQGKKKGFVLTNGHSMTNIESENTNFAFLVRTELTEPLSNTVQYGRSIAKLATTIGGGKPVLQRMGDLRRGRRSNKASLRGNHVINTLRDVTYGNIAMALPHRILTDIMEGLEVLDKIIPGVASDSTLLYAPEIKFYSMELDVDTDMETSINNLFAAGDGAGLSRDIVNAAATGIIAARGIIKKQGK